MKVTAVRGEYRFDVWVRKSDDGEMPVPRSESARLFYEQLFLEGFPQEDGPVPAIQQIDVLALWDTPRNYTHISGIDLACPERGGDVRADVRAHWQIPVPHPMTTHHVDQEQQGGEEPADDLDIGQEPDEMTGTNDAGGNDE